MAASAGSLSAACLICASLPKKSCGAVEVTTRGVKVEQIFSLLPCALVRMHPELVGRYRHRQRIAKVILAAEARVINMKTAFYWPAFLGPLGKQADFWGVATLLKESLTASDLELFVDMEPARPPWHGSLTRSAVATSTGS